MISSNLTVFGGNKEKDKMVFTFHFDVGFISSLNMVYFSLIGQVEPMTIGGNHFGVVEDSLIRKGQIEDIAQNKGSLSGRNTQRYVEGKGKAESIKGVVDFKKARGIFFLGGQNVLTGPE